MPQIFNVLNCCQCGTFQVHQVVKARRWTCKMCGTKQSFLKVFTEGSGAECRQVVQKLNMARSHSASLDVAMAAWGQTYSDTDTHTDPLPVLKPVDKWNKYLQTESVDEEVDEDDEIDGRTMEMKWHFPTKLTKRRKMESKQHVNDFSSDNLKTRNLESRKYPDTENRVNVTSSILNPPRSEIQTEPENGLNVDEMFEECLQSLVDSDDDFSVETAKGKTFDSKKCKPIDNIHVNKAPSKSTKWAKFVEEEEGISGGESSDEDVYS